MQKEDRLSMELLQLIRERCSIRKYSDRVLPEEAVNKIVEAGIWGPSVPSFLRIQPWKFVVIKDKKMVKGIAGILAEKAKVSPSGISLLLKSAAGIVEGAALAIAVYNSDDVEKVKGKYKEAFANFAEILPKAELCAISAAIQNMILVAAAQDIGSCWLDMPLFCDEDINVLLGEKLKLTAILTFGFPAEMGKRAVRKPSSEAVRFIE